MRSMASGDVAKLFDRLADSYDAVGVDLCQPIAEGLVAVLGVQPGDRALDIGCGKGAALIPLARAVAPEGSVMGIDASPRMVELARVEVTRAGVEADVSVGDAMNPDLPIDFYDAVASSLVLFFLPDPLAALRAWSALLVEDGRVGVSTFGESDQRWQDEVDAVFRDFAAPEIADARAPGPPGPFASDESMETLLRNAGFRGVRTAATIVSPRFDDAEHWYRWSMSVGQRQFWEAIPEHHLDDARTTLFAAVERCHDPTGRIGFDQYVRYTIGQR